MAANSQHDPGSSALQYISLILAGVGVIIAIIALPDNTRAAGIITGVLGLGACSIFVVRLGRNRTANTPEQVVKPIDISQIETHPSSKNIGPPEISVPPSYATAPSQAIKPQYERKTKSIVKSRLLYALSISIVLLMMIWIYFSLFGNISHWGSIVFLVLVLSYFISLIYLIWKVSQATLHNIIKVRVIIVFTIIIFAVSFVIIKLFGINFSSSLWIGGLDVISVFAIVGAIIVFIVVLFIAGFKKVRGNPSR